MFCCATAGHCLFGWWCHHGRRCRRRCRRSNGLVLQWNPTRRLWVLNAQNRYLSVELWWPCVSTLFTDKIWVEHGWIISNSTRMIYHQFHFQLNEPMGRNDPMNQTTQISCPRKVSVQDPQIAASGAFLFVPWQWIVITAEPGTPSSCSHQICWLWHPRFWLNNVPMFWLKTEWTPLCPWNVA